MAILSIITAPDRRLKVKSQPVEAVDEKIRGILNDMLETMYADVGRVGLAAPQVGISLRVLVIGIPEEEDIVLINPAIVKRKGERLIDEGCLSVPGYVGQVKRAESITTKGHNQNGKEIRIKAEGLLAQALEHEIDHLNGVLYFDHLEDIQQLHKIEPKETEL